MVMLIWIPMDGIPTQMLMDGDGCSDAKEAGYTDADGDGEVDGTGYDFQLEWLLEVMVMEHQQTRIITV